MLELWSLLLCFVTLVFGLGPALMPRGLGDPLQRTAVGVAASLVVIYLVSFGIYVLNLPVTAHRYLLLLPPMVAVLRRRPLAEHELLAERLLAAGTAERVVGLDPGVALAHAEEHGLDAAHQPAAMRDGVRRLATALRSARAKDS